MSLLRVQDLGVAYGPHQAVEGVSFTLEPGQILGLVGESGSGKSTVINGMLRLLPAPARVTSGVVELQGCDLLQASAEVLQDLRWTQVAVVPQSALSALNPVLTIGAHFGDTRGAHDPELALSRVGLDPKVLAQYPHELSGGMRQRVALALALAATPPLIVMDEPTTALDVVVERDILRTLLELQRELGFGVLFITHDLALLRSFCTHIGVLYGGHLVELGAVEDIGTHPYTRGLLDAIPPAIGEDREPTSIPGAPPRIDAMPPGCRFAPRCPLADTKCQDRPPFVDGVACWKC
ncbi:MAG: ABC transporter ATP-binding protein [Myxococcota bacterium]|nr:ABC transporter ATP-binding protein [Myxococcota bacterium]